MIVAAPEFPHEICLLAGLEKNRLLVLDDEKKVLLDLEAPEGGWTYELLSKHCDDIVTEHTWDAFLVVGDEHKWIGSSEV